MNTMKKLTITTAAAGALAAAALGLAGAAAAAPSGVTSAADTVANLRAQGYNVQINGTSAGSLSSCTVTGVHGLSAMKDPSAFDTVYVDISCPSRID